MSLFLLPTDEDDAAAADDDNLFDELEDGDENDDGGSEDSDEEEESPASQGRLLSTWKLVISTWLIISANHSREYFAVLTPLGDQL